MLANSDISDESQYSDSQSIAVAAVREVCDVCVKRARELLVATNWNVTYAIDIHFSHRESLPTPHAKQERNSAAMSTTVSYCGHQGIGTESIIAKLHVRALNGNTIIIKDIDKYCNTVGTIHDILLESEGISLNDKRYLSFNGKHMKDKRQLLVDFGITDGSKLDILHRLALRSPSWGRKTLEVDEVSLSDTVEKLKMIMQSKGNIDAKGLKLTYQNRQLEDDLPLHEYNIDTDSTILFNTFLLTPSCRSMNVKTVTNGTVKIPVQSSDRVGNIMVELEKRKHVTYASNWRLIYDGKKLDNNTFLSTSIDDKATLYLVPNRAASSINISTLGGEMFQLTVKPHDNIGLILREFQREHNIREDCPRIFFLDKQLNLNRTLEQYGVYDNATLHFKILVHTNDMSGNGVALNLKPADLIENVKIAILQRVWMPKRQIRLFYHGKELEERCTLGDYGIKHNETINFIQYDKLPDRAIGRSIPRAEFRGITLSQLKDIASNIYLKCETEKWKSTDPKRHGELLKPEEVTLYDLCHYFIKPMTEERACSYVELVASGIQTPTWFVSHWWGEPIFQFITCLEQHSFDRGLGSNAVYWVCAYAINQHEIQLDMNPKESPFLKAMEMTEGTVSVIDRDCICYTRIWCAFEISVAVRDFAEQQNLSSGNQNRYLYDVYTAKDVRILGAENDADPAVGLTNGPVASDKYRRKHNGNLNIEDKTGVDGIMWQSFQNLRQLHFPLELCRKAFQIRLEKANSSRKEDKRRILNCIAGTLSSSDEEPPAAHDSYDEVNTMLRGTFAASSYPLVVEAMHPCNTSEISHSRAKALLEEYNTALLNAPLRMLQFSFGNTTRFRDYASSFVWSLPSTLEVLDLDLTYCSFDSDDFTCGFSRLTNLRSFKLYWNFYKHASIDNFWMSLSYLKKLEKMKLRLENFEKVASIDGFGKLLSALPELRLLDVQVSRFTKLSLFSAEFAEGIKSLDKATTLHLDFEECPLKNHCILWDAIGTLSALEDLGLSFRYNQDLYSVDSLGPAIAYLKHLISLKLDFSGSENFSTIKGLRGSVGQLPALQSVSLDFSGTSLKSIDGNFSSTVDKISTLRMNFVSCKQLNYPSVCSLLCSETYLEHLHLNFSENAGISVGGLGESIGCLKELESLTLIFANCPGISSVVELAESIKNLGNVTSLKVCFWFSSLSDRTIIQICKLFTSMSTLKKLSVEFRRLVGRQGSHEPGIETAFRDVKNLVDLKKALAEVEESDTLWSPLIL